jgi:hypothetical protein
MPGDVYSTTTLLEVLEQTRTLNPFWLSFFDTQINFETTDIMFDMVSTDYRSLAPFVVPNVQGRVMGLGNYSSKSFKPAYVKPKHVVDPNMVIERRPGERLGTGSLSLEARRNAVIAEILRIHDALHVNRREWMAAKAIIDGAVTIASEDYPTTLVDFRRDASLTTTLTGGAAWSANTATPLADLKRNRMRVNALSGQRLTKHVFGANAWDMFCSRVDLKGMMQKDAGGYNTNVTLMEDGYEGQEFMGVIQGSNGGGRIEAWVDTSKYKDASGNEQFFLEQNAVVGVASPAGVRCFGAIKDLDRLSAVEMFPKMWREQDPSVEYIMTQSAPLMVPKFPNATFKMTVAAPQ